MGAFVEQSGPKWGVRGLADGTEETERHHPSPLHPSPPSTLPCLLNSLLTVAKAALSRLSTQSMPLIWPLSSPTPKMYFSSCLTSLVSGTLRRETIIALLKGYPGYSRIILAGLSLHYMSYHPKYCTLLYCISCLLDAVDGQAARALGQTSKFGAVLDMVTDRYGTR
jgi:CDP-alcohol phosphatidyltransferase-like enzyme